jgi:Rieske Fe-S protein
MHRDIIGHRRRDVIVSAGLGLVAAALAACTTYGKKPAPAAPAPAGPATPTANTLAKTSDVPVGSGVIIDDVVLTQPSQGVFNGLSAICTHAGCTVAEVAGGTINCPCHGSRYNLDGSVANGPASRPLAAKAISVQGNSIVLG